MLSCSALKCARNSSWCALICAMTDVVDEQHITVRKRSGKLVMRRSLRIEVIISLVNALYAETYEMLARAGGAYFVEMACNQVRLAIPHPHREERLINLFNKTKEEGSPPCGRVVEKKEKIRKIENWYPKSRFLYGGCFGPMARSKGDPRLLIATHTHHAQPSPARHAHISSHAKQFTNEMITSIRTTA